ncbi:MAG: hypothetical protein WCH04_09050 [Gammaproteobacteria bacterium]
MKKLIFAVFVGLLTVSTSFAQMGGGMGGDQQSGGGCWGTGGVPGGGHKGGNMRCGKGYGLNGAGVMVSGMMGNLISRGHLITLNSIVTVDQANTAFQAFITSASSTLSVGEIWEYDTAYKAELVDTNGARAFDLLADKFTGVVTPAMGFSMMMNASYGKGLYKKNKFGKNFSVTPEQATTIVQEFVTNNNLGYTLGTPVTYPGYYKFHTQNGPILGMDIIVNGYDGGIWMNSLLGAPLQGPLSPTL